MKIVSSKDFENLLKSVFKGQGRKSVLDGCHLQALKNRHDYVKEITARAQEHCLKTVCQLK